MLATFKKIGRERRKAAGEAPVLVNYLTMAVKLNPNLERATEFASTQTSGEMARDLRRRIYESRIHSGEQRVLREFARDWKDVCPEFERAVYLIESAVGERNPANRERTLDGALELILEGARKRMRDFASSIHLPTLMIYSIGVLVPLVLVALLPTFSMVSANIGLAPIIAVYLFILPLVVYLMSYQVLSKRPSALDATDIPTKSFSFQLLILLVALIALPLTLTSIFELSKDVAGLISLWGIVSAVSFALYSTSAEAFRKRRETYRMEEEFCDALVQLGNRVSEGCPAEDVFRGLCEGMKGGALERVFRRVLTNVNFGGAGLQSAILDREQGALSRVNSRMIGGIMGLLVNFVERSTRAAGKAILQVAEHLRKLVEIKTEIRRMLGELVMSMRSVAIFFAPLVASVTAKIQELLFSKTSGVQFFDVSAIAPADFAIVLGTYTVILAALLMNYAVELEFGNDKVVKRMVIAVSLPVALTVFTVGWVVSGLALNALMG